MFTCKYLYVNIIKFMFESTVISSSTSRPSQNEKFKVFYTIIDLRNEYRNRFPLHIALIAHGYRPTRSPALTTDRINCSNLCCRASKWDAHNLTAKHVAHAIQKPPLVKAIYKQCSDSTIMTVNSLSIAAPCNVASVGCVKQLVERPSLINELSLSCTQPAADGWPLMW